MSRRVEAPEETPVERAVLPPLSLLSSAEIGTRYEDLAQGAGGMKVEVEWEVAKDDKVLPAPLGMGLESTNRNGMKITFRISKFSGQEAAELAIDWLGRQYETRLKKEDRGAWQTLGSKYNHICSNPKASYHEVAMMTQDKFKTPWNRSVERFSRLDTVKTFVQYLLREEALSDPFKEGVKMSWVVGEAKASVWGTTNLRVFFVEDAGKTSNDSMVFTIRIGAQ